MRGSTITAIQHCLPKKVLKNSDLYKVFGKGPIDNIYKISGIKERRIAEGNICASDLAHQAAKHLIDEKAIDVNNIDTLIFVSETPDYQAPPTACVLHKELGLPQNCGSFDINHGCSGFPYGLKVAHSMIVSGESRMVLLLIADTLTKFIHPNDRSLIALHGDGGAALLIEPCEKGSGIINISLGTDGSNYQHLMIPSSGSRIPKSENTKHDYTDEFGVTRNQESMYMNGPAVFSFSLNKVPQKINEALREQNLDIEDLDLLLLHQANLMMINRIYDKLNTPDSKRFTNLELIGNCAVAASPIVLSDAWKYKKIKPGDLAVIASFGMGLSWGTVTIKWPNNIDPTIYGNVDFEQEIIKCPEIYNNLI